MADPQKLPSGAWRIQWHDASGKRRSETFKTFDAARSAQRRRVTQVEDVRAGRTRPGSDRTLAELAPEWLAARKPAPGSAPDVLRRRNNRVRDNTSHLNKHILPALGELRPHEVSPDALQKFIRELEAKPTARKGEKNEAGRTLSAAMIANVIITLRKFLRDVADHRGIMSYTVPEQHYEWIRSAADVARFLEAIKTPWFRIACELAVYSGLRQGEVAGLRWTAVDFTAGTLMIDRSYDGPTKSKHARAVPLAPDLAERLKRWRLETGAASRGLVIAIGGEMLGEHCELGKRVRRVCGRIKIAPVTFHQLRHTYASHLAQRVSLPVVGAVLGHADPKTTARYAHVDTAALARDPRLHLTFEAPSGTVSPLDPAAHAVHTKE